MGEFDWKQKLDLLSCTECGRCQEFARLCFRTAANPKMLIMDLRDYMVADEARAATGPLIGGALAVETLWSCTTCRACMDICPVHIEQMTKIIDMRRAVVKKPAPSSRCFRARSAIYNNTAGLLRQASSATRTLDRRSRLSRQERAQGAGRDVLWFVGDFASYDPRAQKITAHVAGLFRAAGVDFGILFEAEAQCRQRRAPRWRRRHVRNIGARQY